MLTVELVAVLEGVNLLLTAVFAVFILYQFVYMCIGLYHRKDQPQDTASVNHRYAVLISARNEEGVIAELLRSLKAQNYPQELLDLYVVADNCTDNTAGVAEAEGATVFRRFNRRQVGKGYALDYLLGQLRERGLWESYDGYMVFDADNIVDPNFVKEMNATFDTGAYDAITSYRNSKNFGQNWITAGYSIWFLREARLVNASRTELGTNCNISGTGFLVSGDLIREMGGWPYHLLNEDFEFTAACNIQGKRIGYCDRAVIYDEQPVSLRQSWNQRLRWCKGFLQVTLNYGASLFKGIFKGGRSGWGCYDFLMVLTPGLFAVASFLVQSLIALLYWVTPGLGFHAWLPILGNTFLGFGLGYAGLVCYAAATVASEWDRIRATTAQKLLHLFTFPFFMMTYFPINLVAFVSKVEWKPIPHRSMAQIDAI